MNEIKNLQKKCLSDFLQKYFKLVDLLRFHSD